MTRSIDASTDCLHVCVVFFLFCFICLLFCNCIFLTKNKEITLELYFFFVLLCFPSVFFLRWRSFFCFVLNVVFVSISFYPGAFLFFLLLLLECFLIFVCLFLIKDTVNYFLTFLYSCSWIVLLCEFLGVCCRRWPFYGKRKKCRWKTKRKNVKFKAKHSTISSPLSFFSSRSLVHLYLILRLSHSRLAKLFTKYFFFFFVWSRSRSLSFSLSTQTHFFAVFFSLYYYSCHANKLLTLFKNLNKGNTLLSSTVLFSVIKEKKAFTFSYFLAFT